MSLKQGKGDRVVAVQPLEPRCLLSASFPTAVSLDMAYDSLGNLHVAYQDTVDRNLKYTYRTAAGQWTPVQTVDVGPSVGAYLSLAVDDYDRPGIAYYDSANADLKYAKFSGSNWVTETVHSTTKTGYYPSLAFNLANRPVISFYHATPMDLKVAVFTNAGTWSIQTADGSADDVGRHNAVAIDPATGRWVVAYDSSTTGKLLYARQTSGSVSLSTLENVTGGASYISIQFDPTGLATVAYYDIANTDLRYARGSENNWTIDLVAGKNTQGLYTSMWYEPNGKARIVYYNVTSDRLTMVEGNSGNWSNFTTLINGGGRLASAARNPVSGAVSYAFILSSENVLYINDSNAGKDWSMTTATAGWSKRDGAGVVNFNGKMWLVGGYDVNLPVSDVWSSTDGAVWTLENGTAAFGGRTYHSTTVFDGKMWMIGGADNLGYARNDVWYSTDGVNWTQATAAAPFATRYNHRTLVFNNELWVIGGFDGVNWRNDIWRSADGVNWTQVTAAAGFDVREAFGAVVFGGRMWVIGGYGQRFNGDLNVYRNDIWSSADGVTWAAATTAAPFGMRSGMAVAVYDNRIWLVGGVDSVGQKNDVWYSFDGTNWQQSTAAATFAARSGHASTVYGGKLWIFGGTRSGTLYNDVWNLFSN